MHRLAELSVRRPVLASVLILGLVFLGLVSYSRLTVERWPNIDIPFVAVSVRVPGASPEEVESVGGQARQINVLIDPARLMAYPHSTTDVSRSLQAQNVQIPAGSIDRGMQRLTLRTLGRVSSLDELQNLVVVNRGGVPVTLADLARIEDGAAEPETTANIDGTPAVLLQVRKQSGTHTIQVAREIQGRLGAITSTNAPGYHVALVRDQSVFVEASTHAVQEHLLVGSLLAAAVVLVFLWNVRSTFIAAIAIPTSIISTFALLAAMGLTLNTITLLALALVVGIVIDDAIVVLENIYRFMQEKGMPPLQAAIEGTREVGGAVTATTMSLIAVFLPLAFMSGIVGRFMRSFGYTMAFAIAVSLLVSFTLTPMMSARWLRPRRSGSGETGSSRGRIFTVMEAWYRRLLEASLRRRWVVVVLTLLTLFSVAPLGMAVNKNFLPEDDTSQFEVVVRAPEGWNLNATERLGTQMAADIRRLQGINYTIVTTGDDPQHSPNRVPNYARMADVEQRSVSQDSMIIRVRNEVLPRYAPLGLHTQVGPASEFGGSGQFQPIEYVIGGPDLAGLTPAAPAGGKGLRGSTRGVALPAPLFGGV